MEKKASDGRIISKIKEFYMENKWNIFDVVVFLVFYLAFSIRFSPIFGKVYNISSENCYEAARFSI